MNREEQLAAWMESWERARLSGTERSLEELCREQPERFSELCQRVERYLQIEQLVESWEEANDSGQPISPEELCRDHPDLLLEIKQRIAALKAFEHQYGETLQDSKDVADPSNFCGGRYELQGVYESGGLGVLYHARDTELNRPILVKTVLPRWEILGDVRPTFEREAQITGQLEHPGIVPVYGFGRNQNGRPYYAMKFVHGQTLSSSIRGYFQISTERSSGERTVEFQQLLRNFIAVCQTIAFAHSQQIIHRDLKPDNIMVGNYGEVLVIDWGLAKRTGEDDRDDIPGELTHSEVFRSMTAVKGTPAYMSPEQARIRREPVGPASDIFSLGATLFEILTGQRPFSGKSSQEILHQIETGELPQARSIDPRVPAALDAICRKAMRNDPDERYSDAQQLARDIERWLADEPVTAWNEPWWIWVRRSIKRHRTVAAGIAAALLVTFAAVLIASGLLAAKQRQLLSVNEILEERNIDLRQSGYMTQFQLAESAWREGNLKRAERMLDQTDADLRGLEWAALKEHLKVQELAGTEHAAAAEHLGMLPQIGAVSCTDISPNGTFCAVGSYRVMTDLKRLSTLGWTLSLYDLRAQKHLWKREGDGFLHDVIFSEDESQIAAVVEPIPEGYQPGDKIREALKKSQEQSQTSQRDFLKSINDPLQVEMRKKLLRQLQNGNTSKPDQPPDPADEKIEQLVKERLNQPPADPSPPASAVDALREGREPSPPSTTFQYLTWKLASDDSPTPLTAEEFSQTFDQPATSSGTGVFLLENHRLKLELPAPAEPSEVVISHDIEIQTFSLRADGRMLVTVGADRRIRLWNVFTGSKIGEFPSQAPSVQLIRVFMNPLRVVWVGSDGMIRTANLESIAQGLTIPQDDESGDVLALAVSTDDSELVTVTREARIRVWDLTRKQKIREIRVTSHPFDPATSTIVLSPDGSRLALLENGTNRLFETQTGNLVGKEFAAIAPLVFSSDGRMLVATLPEDDQQSSAFLFVDASTGLVRPPRDHSHRSVSHSNGPPRDISISPSGKTLAVLAATGKTLEFWDIASNSIHTQSFNEWLDEGGASQLVYGSDDASLFTIDAAQQTIHRWQVDPWKLLSTIEDHPLQVTGVSLSGDGRRLATSSLDGTVRLWDPRTGDMLWTFPHQDLKPIWSLQLIDNGRRLLAGSNRIFICGE